MVKKESLESFGASFQKGESMSEVASIFCDGGVKGRNPSAIGGTWAYCLVDAAGHRLRWDSGGITPEVAGLPKVSNNLTELLAAVRGMEAVPLGWDGIIFTDSFVTLCRIRKTRKQAKLKGIPQWLVDELALSKKVLGAYRVELVKGHPTVKDLAAGHRGGVPVSIHNAFCDRLCREVSLRHGVRKISHEQADRGWKLGYPT